MKKICLLTLLLSLTLGFSQGSVYAQDTTVVTQQDSAFMARVKALPGVVDVQKIPVVGKWAGKYRISFLQEVDHNNPAEGYFLQRLFLNHKDFHKPMVVVTEGYGADYGKIPIYQTEVTGLVDGNQLIIEHRYFGTSVPAKIDWDYMTVAQAAADHHAIIQSFKDLYDGKWISTGISKGGQTVMFHKSLYPDDVDFSIPYVCPLNFGVEDGRHEPFIAHDGTPEARKAVKNFQLELLKKKKELMPLFQNYVKENKYTFRLPIEQIYDFCVLEYSFAFWQWSADKDIIPGKKATNEEIFKHFMNVASPEYFDINSGFLPFFVQAAREIGYYGYDTKDFKKYLSIPTAKGYLSKLFLPDSLHIKYNPKTMQDVQKYFDENDPKIIFIYGEYDPWSASSIQFSNKKNMIKVVKPGGTHATRISNLPAEQKKMVEEKIKEWLHD